MHRNFTQPTDAFDSDCFSLEEKNGKETTQDYLPLAQYVNTRKFFNYIQENMIKKEIKKYNKYNIPYQ